VQGGPQQYQEHDGERQVISPAPYLYSRHRLWMPLTCFR
jgi:hypothetical protein